MLMKFIEKALAIGGDSIQIEYKDRKEWITTFRGCVGFGIGSLSPDKAKTIFKEMDDLKRRKEVTIGRSRYRLVFSQQESFGEQVYWIRMNRSTGSGQRAAPPRGLRGRSIQKNVSLTLMEDNPRLLRHFEILGRHRAAS